LSLVFYYLITCTVKPIPFDVRISLYELSQLVIDVRFVAFKSLSVLFGFDVIPPVWMMPVQNGVIKIDIDAHFGISIDELPDNISFIGGRMVLSCYRLTDYRLI